MMVISDLGLDRTYSWATPEIAKSRRAVAKEVLVELLAEASDHRGAGLPAESEVPSAPPVSSPSPSASAARS